MASKKNNTDNIEKMARKRIDSRFDFLTHAFIYVIVNGGLALFNYIQSRDFRWAIFPAFFWGIGLFAHALSILFNDFLSTWREDLVKKEAKKIKDSAKN